MSTAKEDCEQLLDFVMPFAIHSLSKDGEFFPFGGVMLSTGECVLSASYIEAEDDRPESTPLIELLEEGLRSRAASGECIATVIVYDALTIPPGKQSKQDTVICSLEHLKHYSIDACFPYTLKNGCVEFEESFATKAEHKVFGRN